MLNPTVAVKHAHKSPLWTHMKLYEVKDIGGVNQSGIIFQLSGGYLQMNIVYKKQTD